MASWAQIRLSKLQMILLLMRRPRHPCLQSCRYHHLSSWWRQCFSFVVCKSRQSKQEQVECWKKEVTSLTAWEHDYQLHPEATVVCSVGCFQPHRHVETSKRRCELDLFVPRWLHLLCTHPTRRCTKLHGPTCHRITCESDLRVDVESCQ